MKWFKRILLLLLAVMVLAAIGLFLLQHKAKNGWARYETDEPSLDIDHNRPAILHFTKTTGWRHSAAIEASKAAMRELSDQHNWQLYQTEEGGVFNEQQLALFDVVIWDNSTGPVLNEDQQKAFQGYIENGGGYVGIHGAGDFSHHKWPWYTDKLICAEFSHHPIKNQIQKTTVFLSETADSSWTSAPVWSHSDEWYIFHASPTVKGANIIYHIDGNTIDPDGNLLFLASGYDYGMGDVHPVSWTNDIGQGRSFYTSMGHTAETFNNKSFLDMLVNGIRWAGQID